MAGLFVASDPGGPRLRLLGTAVLPGGPAAVAAGETLSVTYAWAGGDHPLTITQWAVKDAAGRTVRQYPDPEVTHQSVP